jgi:hypothetical protein
MVEVLSALIFKNLCIYNGFIIEGLISFKNLCMWFCMNLRWNVKETFANVDFNKINLEIVKNYGSMKEPLTT